MQLSKDQMTLTVTVDAEQAQKVIEEEMAKFTPALRDVVAERERQQTAEGRTFERDDVLYDGQLAAAAATYALSTTFSDGRRSCCAAVGGSMLLRSIWPWSPNLWKMKDRRRDLVRAGALILAEIERIDRKERRAVAHHPA